MRGEVCLVDDKQVGPRDRGTALARNFLSGGDINQQARIGAVITEMRFGDDVDPLSRHTLRGDVAGGGIHPVQNGMATAADWMSAASFISMAGLISTMGYAGGVYLMGWTGGYVLLVRSRL